MGNLTEIQGIEIQPSSFQGGCLPKGDYLCELKNSEVKESKSGGKYLKLDFVICDGSEYDSYHIFENLNIINANEKAQQIALGMLSQLSKACGKAEIPDESYELHDIKVVVGVKVEKSSNPAYPDDKNRVTHFKPYTLKSVVVGSNKAVAQTPAQEAFGSDDIGF
jgi:hypothetical protein